MGGGTGEGRASAGHDRAREYALVVEQMRSLLDGCPGFLAAMATAAALLKDTLDHASWVGFYLPAEDGSLTIGPYQGPLACIRLAPGKGVCGAVASSRRTIVVDDVHAFPGHIACDPRSRSEIVVPLLSGNAGARRGDLLAVLDVDSHLKAAFGEHDRKGLEAIAGLVANVADERP